MAKAKEQQPNLLAQAEQIARDFDLSADHVLRLTRHLVRQMQDGLASDSACQLPVYLRSMPTGTEKGQFLAVDLGGTNCRICLVELHGDSTFAVAQTKSSVPPAVMVNRTYLPLFDFIAQRTADFLHAHLDPSHQLPYRLGFTFSFACEQTSLTTGRVLRWDKGWDLPDAVGRDPCVMLQEAIDRVGLPVQVTVLANDSVGTLLTRSYISGQKISTLGAVIFGTGTNAAYVEKLSNVRRLGLKADADGIMVINSEWGGLDDKMEVLPRTPLDDELDAASGDPGSQMLEKRVSGRYLGELLRLAIVGLLHADAFRMTVNKRSKLFQQGGIDSSLLSQLAITDTNEIGNTVQLLQMTLSAENVSHADAQAIQLLAKAIARRAARIAGASLAAMIIQSGRLNMNGVQGHVLQKTTSVLLACFKHFECRTALLWRPLLNLMKMMWKPSSLALPQNKLNPKQAYPTQEIIDIGADGSLIEFYPTFEAEMRSAMRDIPEIGHAGERRVQISLTKDGSGVGAALMAQAASQTVDGGTRTRV